MSETRLKKGAIGFPGALAVSLEATGPLLGALAGIVLAASVAGQWTPAVIVGCGLAMSTVAYTIVRFARRLPQAASIYSYIGHGLGERVAFLSSWTAFVYYGLFVPQLLLAFGIFAHSGLETAFAISIPWWILSAAAGVVATTFALIGIKLSARVDLTAAAVANTVLAICSLGLIAKALSSASISFSRVQAPPLSFSTVALAITFGTLSFLGFEQSITLAEEAVHPQRTIPKAIWTTLALIGALLTIVAIAFVMGMAGPPLPKGAASSLTPWWALVQQRLGHGWAQALAISAIISILGNVIASFNAVVRLEYGMGRAKALPRLLARTLAKARTPYVAILLQASLSFLIAFGIGFRWDPSDLFGLLSYLNGLAGAIVFIVILLAGIRYFRRVERSVGPMRNLIIPVFGIIILAPAVYTSFYPFPAGSAHWGPPAIGGWIAVGLVLTFIRKGRASATADPVVPSPLPTPGRNRDPEEFIGRAAAGFREGFSAVAAVSRPAIAVFGSSDLEPGSAQYEFGRQIGRKLAERGFAVVTGGGPGLMAAANQGASEVGDGYSYGWNIALPTPQPHNDYLDLGIHFEHFYVRKVMYVEAAEGYVIMPGGYGTLNEAYELLTLMKAGKIRRLPIVLTDSDYWAGLLEWSEQMMLRTGTVAKEDFELFTVCDDIDEIVSLLADAYLQRNR